MQPKTRKILTFLFVGALLVFAFILYSNPWIRRHFPSAAPVIRMMIHLGLLIFWGSSILKRIVHKRVRLMFLLIYALMLFWIIDKNLKFMTDGYYYTMNRYFWYFYYVPWLTIPLLVLCIVLFSGKADSYRIPKSVYLVHAGTLFFILLVLTNDLHQLVFVFHSEPFRDGDYHYNIGFFALCVWCYGIAVFSFIWLVRKNRNPKLKAKLLVPIIPFLILFAYEICYLLGYPIVTKCFRDTTVMHCAIFVAILEGCVQIGLIASNRQYRELFGMCNIPLALKREGEFLTSGTGFPFSEEKMEAALETPVITMDNQRITSKSIKGIQVFWADDMTEIKSLSSELQSINEELAEKNEVARLEFEEERKNLILKEKNRLYNIIQEETKDRLLLIEELLGKVKEAESFQEERENLLRIAVLSVYIKRRNNLLFETESGHSIHSDELKRALTESLNYLEDFGIRVSVGFMPDRNMELNEITGIFNAYEEILEAICLTAEGIRVVVSDYGQDITLTVLAESSVDYSSLDLEGIEVEKEDERDYLFTYSIEKWA